jgi:uncharacterized protein YdeI (YjbR/CyaY-like superfamily)
MDVGKKLYVTTRQGFRNWLAKNHQSETEIWLVIYKKASSKPTISYNEAVEEAICFGWVDSMMKSIDTEKYAQRFSPRRKGSNWTEANRAKAQELIEAGQMTKAGLAALPPELQSDQETS